MKKRDSKPVNPSLLTKYVISIEDSQWVNESVEVAFRQTEMNWTDSTYKAREIASTILQKVESRFKQRFPTFDEEVRLHTVRGRSAGPLMFLWFIVWPIVGFFSFPFIDWSALSALPQILGIPLVLGALYGIPFLWIRGLGWMSYWEIPDKKPHELIDGKDAWVKGVNLLVREAVDSRATAKFFESTSLDPVELKASVRGLWQPNGSRPLAPSQAMSPRDAELYVAAYMKFYGATGVSETRYTRDGGVDVDASIFVAQVKHQEANVGVKALREFYGVATSTQKTPLFFTKHGYTKDALEFAQNNAMALFTYLPHLQGVNEESKKYIERGMESS
jgi:hypothetical protein